MGAWSVSITGNDTAQDFCYPNTPLPFINMKQRKQ